MKFSTLYHDSTVCIQMKEEIRTSIKYIYSWLIFMFVVKDPLSTNFQTNVFKAGRTNSSWINVLPKCVFLLDKCVLFALMHLVVRRRLGCVEGYSYKNLRRASCVIYSILFCSLFYVQFFFFLSASLLFMFKEEDHVEDGKRMSHTFSSFLQKGGL